MKCEMIKEKIDKMIFEENELHTAEISSHFENCDSCHFYFTESRKAKNIIGHMQKEPELPDPEDLSKSILSQIDKVEQTSNANNGNHKIYLLIRRSLAAASVCLMIVFGIEQYVIFDKISKMEEHVSSVSAEDKNVNLYNVINYNLGFQAESVNKLFAEGFIIPAHLNLKNKIIRTRLSALIFNKMDNQSINQIMKEASSRSMKDTK